MPTRDHLSLVRACALAACALLALPAHASKPDPGPAVAPDDTSAPTVTPARSADAGAAITRLEAAVAARDAAAVDAAVAELAAAGEAAIEPIAGFLARERSSTPDQGRKVLRAIRADVPDRKGRFRTPKRKSKNKIRREDDFDWLAALLALTDEPAALPGVADVIADVAAIRALATSEQPAAASEMLSFAFTDAGLVYRDECGRRLRAMTPHSLPALIAGSAARSRPGTKRRYARYQLDRMDRQDPFKVIADAAGDEALLVAVVEAYGAGKHREGVAAVLSLVGSPSPRVREAARAAWLGYVTGRKPPEAPKRKLKMPGGKLSDEEQPLWLNYRELAEVELRRKLEQVTGEKPSRRAKLQAMSEQLFTHYDAERARAAGALLDQAKQALAAGDAASAVAIYDRVLAVDPDHPERAAMAAAYLARASALEKAEDWAAAGAAYSAAHGLAPDAPGAADALSRHYLMLGRVLEAQGKDGSAAYRRAATHNPEDRDAAVAAGKATSRPAWMLYAGVGGGAGAVLLLVIGMALRRRT